jgi:DivIVA domain-containing protein
VKDTIDRIRKTTFTLTRRGYDKREVDTYLAKLADWLEGGGDDQVHSETVKKEMERVGQRVGKILTAAEEAAEGLRADAEREAREMAEVARVHADSARAAADEHAKQVRERAEAHARKTREEADAYAANIRQEADGYSAGIRGDADAYAAKVHADADADATQKVQGAEAKAVQTVEEGARRRREIEQVVADLQGRRDSVLKGLEKLSGELAGAATQYKGGEPRPPTDSKPTFEPTTEAEERPEAETRVVEAEPLESRPRSDPPPPAPTRQ